MAWPTNAWVDGDFVTAGQLNAMPVRIADLELGATTATIDFTSIPQHYAHLSLLVYARTTSQFSFVAIRFNGDTAANYDIQQLVASAAAPAANETFAAVAIAIGGAPTTFTPDLANLFSATEAFIPHYANAANNKCVVSRSADKHNTTTTNMSVRRFAGFWRSNSAITQITIRAGVVASPGSFVAGTRATLYGWP